MKSSSNEAQPDRESKQRRLSRSERTRRALAVADDHDGVAHRTDLRAAQVTRADVRTEVAAGRWQVVGRHTVRIRPPREDRARLWIAVWESGAGARLDGAAALLAAGMTGFDSDTIDVSVPPRNRTHPVEGVRLHRQRSPGPIVGAGVPRVRPEQATLNAAMWAVSDRQAALLICLAVQQRLVPRDRLLAASASLSRGRSAFVRTIVGDVCDGAHSLGELDVKRLCDDRGLPRPTRQSVRRLPGGRAYLDLAWEDHGLVVEVDGGHHALALTPVDDALRQNEVTIAGERVLRIPLVSLRIDPDAFLDQLERALRCAIAA